MTSQLWHLRLSCLARLRLFNQTAAECTNLFSVLNNVNPPEARAYLFERILPFELEVMQTRLKYWAGDHMGYLDALAALLRKCKVNAKQGKSDGSAMSMWKERGSRVALIIASQMVEMKVSFLSWFVNGRWTQGRMIIGIHSSCSSPRASLRSNRRFD